MESTIPRHVRCPKCHRVLEEPPGIALYKCGGCDAILEAKVQSSSGETLSLKSATGSSKNKSKKGSPDKDNIEKQTPSSSDHLGDQDQTLTEALKVSGSSGERNGAEFSGNGMKSHVSDSSGESLKENGKSPVYEKTGIKGIALDKETRTEELLPSKVKNNMNEDVNLSSDKEILAANNCLKPSDKLEESPEHVTSSEDDKIDGKFIKDASFSLRSSFHAYEGSVSSIDEERTKHMPPKYIVLSRRTTGRKTSSVYSGEVTSRKGVQSREREFSFVSEDFQSALNWMESENDAPSLSKSKDAKHSVKFKYSEKDDKVKIIRKVDELRSELLEFFHRSTDAKAHSRLSLTAHFERDVLPKQCCSSLLLPLSKKPNASCLNHHHGAICFHNEHCRHNACCHLPEGTASHHLLHMKRNSSLHKEAQNLQSSNKIRQTVKRHCRPVSGGAPFVICYRCYKLLQLPADFLVSTKRVHKLRCGSCHGVLEYSFRPRIRSMPWIPAEAPHPPSEEENNEALHGEIRVPASNDLAGGDPVSYSEDYDFSFGKSYSYEAEPSRHPPRNDSTVKEEQSGKVQLHKLMGYSSARYLLFETSSPGEGHRVGRDR